MTKVSCRDAANHTPEASLLYTIPSLPASLEPSLRRGHREPFQIYFPPSFPFLLLTETLSFQLPTACCAILNPAQLIRSELSDRFQPMADLFYGSPFRRLLYARPWPSPSQSATGAMDWVETPTTHVIRINVPGLGKDDVKVQVEDGNVLSFRGAAPVKEREDEEGVVWHVAERGKPEGFAREVALPDHVKVEQIRAGVENGVLTVVVPKEPAPARPRPRPVAVSSKL